jgi:hypothetical protein
MSVEHMAECRRSGYRTTLFSTKVSHPRCSSDVVGIRDIRWCLGQFWYGHQNQIEWIR